MVWVWILGGIGLLLLVALAASVKLDIIWEQELTITLRYLFIKKQLLPKAEKPKAKKEEPAPAKKEKPKESNLHKLMDYAEWIPKLVGSVARQVGYVIRRFTLTNTELRVVVAEEDACQTGIRYGQANAAVYTAYGALRQVIRVKEGRIKIDIIPDFLSEQGEVSFRCRLKAPVWAASWAALSLGKDFMREIFGSSLLAANAGNK